MANTALGYVLIIEDLAFMRRLLAGIVKSLGYEVKEAENGTEAINLMKQKKPALVFVDLVMPEVSGIEVCQWIRNTREIAETPVIVCTAHQERKNFEAAVRAGATDFLIKPIDRRALKQRMDKYLPLPEEKPQT